MEENKISTDSSLKKNDTANKLIIPILFWGVAILYFFIKWYWVFIIHNLLLTSSILYNVVINPKLLSTGEKPKYSSKEIALALITPLFFNIIGYYYVAFSIVNKKYSNSDISKKKSQNEIDKIDSKNSKNDNEQSNQEKKLGWPKNEIIEEFSEDLPECVVRSRKIATELYDHAKKVNINNSTRAFIKPSQKNVIVVCQYFDNGEIKSLNCYSHKNKIPKKAHGYSICFYEDSQIKTCCNFIENRIDGMYTSYYSNGFVENILNFDNSNLDGLNYTYHKNEKLSSVVNYKQGLQNGQVYAYHENGNLFFDGQIKNDIFVGTWKIYDDEGNSTGTITYDMGAVIEGDLDQDDLMKSMIKGEWKTRELQALFTDFDSTDKSTIDNESDTTINEEKEKITESDHEKYEEKYVFYKNIKWFDLDELEKIDYSEDKEKTFYIEFTEHFIGSNFQLKSTNENSKIISSFKEEYNEVGWGDFSGKNEDKFNNKLPVIENTDIEVKYLTKFKSDFFSRFFSSELNLILFLEKSKNDKTFEAFLKSEDILIGPNTLNEMSEKFDFSIDSKKEIFQELPVYKGDICLWYSFYELESESIRIGVYERDPLITYEAVGNNLVSKINIDNIEKNEVEINWIYGIDKAFDYKEKEFEKNLVFYKYEEEEGCHVVYKGVNNFDEGKDFIDKIISQNGGQNNFKTQEDQDGYKYIHLGDLFNISYLKSYEIVEIEKVEQFKSVRNESKYGINENDVNIRSLVKGLDKILYNEGEGPANGRLCVRYNNDDSYFVYAYFNELDESLALFKKIVTNYDKTHQIFNKSNKLLDELINSDGINYKSDLFELMLIRENVKYKFYITPPGGFYSNWSFR